MSRSRWLVGALAALLLVAAPAAGDPGSDKARVDARIGDLRGRIAEADRSADVLTDEISAATARIRAVQEDVDAEQALLVAIEADLARRRARLERLSGLLAEQARGLARLRIQHAAAVARLEARIRQIYVEDTPDTLSFVLEATSFADLLDNVEYLNDIGRQDARIAANVREAREEMAARLEQTRATRAEAAEATRVIAARAAEQRAARDRLVASRDALAAARADKEQTLASVRVDRAEYVAEVEALEAQSAALAAKIRAAQAAAAKAAQAAASSSSGATTASTGSGVSASGFVWPVAGPVTSGFGWRWGRMHQGIDISVASGTPVGAAAAGTVIHAGWLGGYGNLVVVDHGNGIATAYAHNSSFAVAVGQEVGQGQVVAYSGNTGNSTGPHVHFEVRVNGSAVDPLGYL